MSTTVTIPCICWESPVLDGCAPDRCCYGNYPLVWDVTLFTPGCYTPGFFGVCNEATGYVFQMTKDVAGQAWFGTIDLTEFLAPVGAFGIPSDPPLDVMYTCDPLTGTQRTYYFDGSGWVPLPGQGFVINDWFIGVDPYSGQPTCTNPCGTPGDPATMLFGGTFGADLLNFSGGPNVRTWFCTTADVTDCAGQLIASLSGVVMAA